MDDYDFWLSDRIQKIRSIHASYDLAHNAFVSFSGGKDSTVLHHLLDMALPNNTIPRVFFNTGIEYKAIVDYVRSLVANDTRFIIVNSGVNIVEVLNDYGYPFKSKEHSHKVSIYQNSGMTKTVKDYLGIGEKTAFLCPDKLKYNFSKDFTLKVNDKCCTKLKKEVSQKWAKENGKSITMTGMRQVEGGQRLSHSCTVFADKDCKELKKFHALYPCSDDFINEFVSREKIELYALYYPPYNFTRTGCKGCPFNLHLQEQLDKMTEFLPLEKKQCEIIWKKVYAEYRRIGYRLTPSLFDEL